MSDPAWSAVEERCCVCGGPLDLLEGPHCDACLNGLESSFTGDRYAPYRDETEHQARLDENRSEYPEPLTGKQRLLVDLTTHRVVFLADTRPPPPWTRI